MKVGTATARQVFSIGLWFRVVCAAVFVAFIVGCEAFGVRFSGTELWLSYLCLVSLVLVNIVYWFVGLAWQFDLRQFYGHWFIDLLLISGVLSGLDNAAVISTIPAYSMIIVTSATFISRSAAFIVATGSAVAFLLLVRSGSLAVGSLEGGEAATSALFLAGNGVIFFYLFAFLAGTLATALNDANSQLTQQNGELARKNEELDNLQREIDFQTVVLTHDIRGPIAAAASAIGMMGSQGDGPAADQQMIAMALENLGRADEMIDDLREVRLAASADLQRTEVDLRKLCSTLTHEFEADLVAGGVRLEVSADLPVVIGDSKRLRIAFRNLLSNAARYVPRDGTGLISVAGKARPDGWEIEVGDNGPGIPAEHRLDVFKSFRKLPGETASRGMGLGLAIVKRVVERHGGRISLETSGSGGAAFRIFLPR